MWECLWGSSEQTSVHKQMRAEHTLLAGFLMGPVGLTTPRWSGPKPFCVDPEWAVHLLSHSVVTLALFLCDYSSTTAVRI